MSDPYLGEIRCYAFSFAPRGWAFCDGSIVALRQQTALYALLGTTFGGDGTTTFQLPNLASRQIVGAGLGTGLPNHQLGAPYGEASVTLQTQQLPPHLHTFQAFTGRGVTPLPTPANGAALSNASSGTPFVAAQPDTTMAPNAVTLAGGSQPHSNTQPILGLPASIAMTGLYPSFG